MPQQLTPKSGRESIRVCIIFIYEYTWGLWRGIFILRIILQYQRENPIARSPDTVLLRGLSLCPLWVITRDPRPQCPTSREISSERINYPDSPSETFIRHFICRCFLHVVLWFDYLSLFRNRLPWPGAGSDAMASRWLVLAAQHPYLSLWSCAFTFVGPGIPWILKAPTLKIKLQGFPEGLLDAFVNEGK